MTETFRCRVDKSLLRSAKKVSAEMGTSTSELVRIFLKALVKNRQLPFALRAESEEDEMLGPISRRRAMLDTFHEG
jgi:addiction module RelB/DinJ family antitoxin